MTHLIRKALLLLLFVALPGFYAMAASVMNYRVQFDTHKDYLEVELSASDLSSGETLFKLPVWAPGYYLIVDFPKNLSDFRVTDVAGAPLPWTKVGKNGWLVANGTHSQIKVSYRIYANSSSVAESLINNERAFVAPNGVFMYVEGEKESGTTIEFAVPSNWKKASTGLSEVEGQPFTFVAPNFDTLYDSPLLFGNQATYDFEVDGLPYHLALETPDGVEQTTFIEDLKKKIGRANA